MQRLVVLFSRALGLLVLAVPLGRAADTHYDLIVRNGRVIDGTGSPWYAADVAIRDGRIAGIGNLGPARALRSIDAHGQCDRLCALRGVSLASQQISLAPQTPPVAA